MTTQELIEKLRRPMYNYTMAMHGDSYHSHNERLRKSSKTRRENAEKEIEELITQYFEERT